jgi:hypothetical protein
MTKSLRFTELQRTEETDVRARLSTLPYPECEEVVVLVLWAYRRLLVQSLDASPLEGWSEEPWEGVKSLGEEGAMRLPVAHRQIRPERRRAPEGRMSVWELRRRLGGSSAGPPMQPSVLSGVAEMINLQREGAQAKPYQVKQVRAVILKAKLGDRE